MSKPLQEFHEFTRDECAEAFNVAPVPGGTITIPHLRGVVTTLDEVEALA